MDMFSFGRLDSERTQNYQQNAQNAAFSMSGSQHSPCIVGEYM